MRRTLITLLFAVMIFPPAPCRGQRHGGGLIEARRPPQFTAPPLSPEARREMEERLAEARAALAKNPHDPEAIIWLGRRTAYLGRYDEAIGIYSRGIKEHPRNAKLYRHRGHRYITLRLFDLAIADLERAARLIRGRPDEVEPDGLPNARNIPTSTLHSNVWYHLGLAYYLKGDFRNARRCYAECLKFSKNPDMLAAAAHWLYMTLRRMNRPAEAQEVLALIRDDADVIENRDYQRLLLMYKGRLTPQGLLDEGSRDRASLGFASTAYGVGNWYFYNGQRQRAVGIFLRLMESPQQTSFGYIAAEADLGRMGITQYPRHPLPERKIY